MTNYTCSDCGHKVKLNQQVCKKCGSELVWEKKSTIDSIIESIIPFREMSTEDKRRYEDRKWLANKMRWTGINGIVSLFVGILFFLLCIIFFAAIF